MTTTTATQVADYFVWLAAHECESDPDYLTPMKLQKLLYFAQGWAFAEWGRPLFDEPIEAWREGPVVPEVYTHYMGREKAPIVPDLSAATPPIVNEDRALIHAVWDAYKQHSGWRLRDMAYAEEAWVEAHKADVHTGLIGKVIDQDAIRRSFETRLPRALDQLAANRESMRKLAAANTKAARQVPDST